MLIKIYYKTKEYPEGGKMTLYLDSLEIGKTIDVRGPFGKFQYLGDGECKILTKFNPITYDQRKFTKIGLLGAGTGITPLYQIIQAADINEEKNIEFTLFFANRTEKDILLRKELDEIAANKRISFKLIYLLSQPDENWKGESGHFNIENIKKYMPEPSDKTIILHCGPRSLCREVFTKVLAQLGHKKENIFEF